MEQAKKCRGVVRSSITKNVNKLEEALQEKDIVEVNAVMDLIEKKKSELDDLNATIYGCLLSDDNVSEDILIKETEECEEYDLKCNRARAKMSKELEEKEIHSTTGGSSSVKSSDRATSSNKHTFKLPQLELKKFSGELKEWLPFWAQFKRIHEDNTIENSDKFQYLIQAITPDSKARNLIESFPATNENYDSAVQCLKSRYGRDDLLVEVYVRELLRLVIQNTVSSSKIELATLYDKLESYLRALETLQVTTEKCAAMLLPLVESSLPEDVLRTWQRNYGHMILNENNDKEDESQRRLERLMQFIKCELENEQKVNLAMAGFEFESCSTKGRENKRKVKESKFAMFNKSLPTATGLVSTITSITCAYCKSSHDISMCNKIQKMSVEERRNVFNKLKCCYNCLKIGHRVFKCRNKEKCIKCGQRHNVLLCNTSKPDYASTTNERQVSNVKYDSSNIQSDNVLTSLQATCRVLLQTLLVKLVRNGRERTTRVIIDTASQRSYVLETVANEMGYPAVRKEDICHVLFGGVNTSVVQHEVFEITVSNILNKYTCNLEVLGQPMICGKVNHIPDGEWLQEVKQHGIQLTDFEDRPVEILIGADIAGKLLTGRKLELRCGLVGLETKLGWTLMGCIPQTLESNNVALIVTSMLVKDANVCDLWSLDILGITDPSERKLKRELQAEAEKHFEKTVHVDEEGRYIVHLPWLADHPSLPNNYEMSLKRLQTTVKKLKNENLYEEYDQVFQEWEKDGIISKVDEKDTNTNGHYLPHRHVVKPNSTTRIRPVFDASAKIKGKPSLNDCVEKGPNLIELMSAVILKFRLRRIGVISDIKKAFLQITLVHQDRNYLRFLWYDKQNNLKIFRHNRVVFGISSSPFLLSSVIRHHLNNKLEECKTINNLYNPALLEILKESFYVDNCVTSVDNEMQLNQFIHQATKLMSEAKFELRGWEFSYSDNHSVDQNQCTNVLGILWNTSSDELKLNVESSILVDNKITKRVILSAAHRIFDPVGIVCPVLLLPKLLLQQMWAEKLNWDQEVNEDVRKPFLKWQRELNCLKELKIDRWLLGISVPTSCSLHVFCDASQTAYAASIFLRTESSNEVNVQLVQAKSRIAPLSKNNKRMTIPRLELMAANVGARLYDSIKEDLSIPINEIIFWSDSTTVLAWINREEQWDVFVRNRIKEIKDLTSIAQWRHVPGTLNPADLPSRGCSAGKLLQSRWWEGPTWLKESPNGWPSTENVLYDEDEINQEKKKIIVSATMLSINDDRTWYYRYFSKYGQMVRMVGWMMRFKANCLRSKEERINGELNTPEVNKAELLILKLIQRESFNGLNDEKLKTLNPILDEDGLMRLKTKVSHGDFDQSFRYPIILPNQNHVVVKAMIFEVHKQSSHAGIQTMMVILRKRFWVLSARRSIRSVINGCVICKRHKATRIEVKSPPLPANRVRDAKIFEIVGIDLAGPIYIKEGVKGAYAKYWICLFTCAVYRAVHLELISSISTDRFIQCLRKFIARRGRPSVIYTDNGTNFVGAANSLSRIDWNKLRQYSSVAKIEWKFNPPTAAWWGGWWERLIGLLKNLLRRVLGKASLDYEEMQTILYECEAVINARPLTYVSEDPTELVPISPDMYLKEIDNQGVADLDVLEAVDFNKRLKYRKHLRDALKQRFREEYLAQLKLHNKKISKTKVQVGEIVLIENENTKRSEWPIAKVVELLPDKEGETRLVRLKTAHGVLMRPVQRIFPLEVEFKSSFEEDKAETIKRVVAECIGKKCETDDQTTMYCIKEHGDPNERVDEEEITSTTTRRGRTIQRPIKLNL